MTDSLRQRGQQWLETLLQLTGVSADVKVELESTAVQGSDFKNQIATG